MATFTTGTGQQLTNVHSISDCTGRWCPIHRPSPKARDIGVTHWREDQRFMERICEHGVGHPDPDDPGADPVHGCDGCCAEPTDEEVEAAKIELGSWVGMQTGEAPSL